MTERGANPIDRANAAPRCAAKAKRTGERCKCPAVTGWRVCRVHGARGGHPPGARHPQYRHGGRTRETMDLRRQIMDLIREGRDTLGQLAGSG